MSNVVYRLEIRGRVQGVFYRQSMIDEAQRLGITGWVRNRHDGSVEAVVAGERAMVKALVDWARRGPAKAEVADVSTFPSEGSFQTFERLPTA